MGLIYSFGDWIRKRRKALDMTQEDLADCVGCSLIMIRKIESDERRPSEQITLRLAECLKVPSDDLPELIKVARGQHAVDRLGLPPTSQELTAQQVRTQIRSVPTELTRFVGRTSELHLISERLVRPDCRLLTLVGLGGIGKTRLAIRAAQKTVGFADGIYFVDLAPLLSSEYLSLVIADVLNLLVTGSSDPQAQLLSHLGDKEMLLILDNFEHLLDGVGLIREILEHAPRVKMLVTSRKKLNLQGEWVYPVEGMRLPPNDKILEPQKSDATQFFFETAQRIRPDYSLHEDWRDVVRICRIIEGNPLGIELAAAQLDILSCREIANRLATSLDLLASTLLNVPERHRSMRAVFEHSWNQLSQEERDVLARLSVFRGGFTLKAAEQVAGGLLPVISSLIDKSLIRLQSSGRYSLHELLRQYAEQKLASDPVQISAAERRHSVYYTDFLHRREAVLRGTGQIAAREEIDIEIQNIHAAWQRALVYNLAEDIEKASTCLMIYFNSRGSNREGLMTFSVANSTLGMADERDEAAQRALMMSLTGHTWFQLMTGSFSPDTRGNCERSLRMARTFGWREWEAYALLMLGLCSSNLMKGEILLRESLAQFEAEWHGSFGWGLSSIMSSLATALVCGKWDQAANSLGEILSAAESSNDSWLSSVAHLFLGKALFFLGSYHDAAHHNARTLALARENGFQIPMVLGLVDAARPLCWKLEDYQKARTLLSESLTRQREIGFLWVMPTTLALLGNTCLELHEYTQAEDYFHEALIQATTIGYQALTVEILNGYGLLLARTGRHEHALELLACVIRSLGDDNFGPPGTYPVALQEIQIRIEDTMARLHLEKSLAGLKAELEIRCGIEAVISVLERRYALTSNDIIPSLLMQPPRQVTQTSRSK